MSITGSLSNVDAARTDSLTLLCRVKLDGGDSRPSSRTGLRLLLLRLDPVVLMLAALSALLGLPRLSSLSRNACLYGRPDIYVLNSSASLSKQLITAAQFRCVSAQSSSLNGES